MKGKASFEPLVEAQREELEELLEEARSLLGKEHEGDWSDLDDRAIKPLQDVLGTDPSEREVRCVAYGLGEILQREFDLDWVTAHTVDGDRIALHIPLSFHLMLPDEFFLDTLENGKPPNVRTTYLERSAWIDEHQFDEEGEVEF